MVKGPPLPQQEVAPDWSLGAAAWGGPGVCSPRGREAGSGRAAPGARLTEGGNLGRVCRRRVSALSSSCWRKPLPPPGPRSSSARRPSTFLPGFSRSLLVRVCLVQRPLEDLCLNTLEFVLAASCRVIKISVFFGTGVRGRQRSEISLTRIAVILPLPYPGPPSPRLAAKFLLAACAQEASPC